jgi:hypothetical protein
MRGGGVNLGPTGRSPGRGCRRGRGRGREAEAAAPKLVYATPYKVLRNPINSGTIQI